MSKISEKLSTITQNYDSVLIVHYACYRKSIDEDRGYSSRVTSIAVLHPSSSTMHSFSLNLVAEQLGIPWDRMDDEYDKIETKMLTDFYAFVRENQGALWVHWKMSNIDYGFQALAHRFTVLTHEPAPTIPDARRFNLSTLIEQKYGRDCVDHPIMYNLMKLNDGLHRDILTGTQEVEAFEGKELKKLHSSTMCKVYWFRNMLDATIAGKVKTQRSNFVSKVSAITEHPYAKVLGFIAVLFALVKLGMLVQSVLEPKQPNTAVQKDVPQAARPLP